MILAIGSDHRGLGHRELLTTRLRALGALSTTRGSRIVALGGAMGKYAPEAPAVTAIAAGSTLAPKRVAYHSAMRSRSRLMPRAGVYCVRPPPFGRRRRHV